MARAAVRAKQAQAAQAQAAANASRKHAAGGNPNQDLFFARLRRRQKWVFLALAIVFGVSFVALGVGSGSGGGLEQSVSSTLSSWFGGGDAVSKAKAEINKDPAKGYQDLATAYLQKNDVTDAVGALKSYLGLRKRDSAVWQQLGGYEQQQGTDAYTQYQQVVQAGQLQSPGTLFQPTGALAGQFGSNPIDTYYQQQNQSLSQPLLNTAFTAFGASLTAYQNAAKYASRKDRPELLATVAGVARLAGNQKAELQALKQYVQLVPNTPNLKSYEKVCKSLGGSCTPQSK